MVNLASLESVTNHLLGLMHNEIWDLSERVGTVARLAGIVRNQAEIQTELSAEQETWFVSLRDAVYEADDLIDELFTREKTRLEPDGYVKVGGCFPAMVRRPHQQYVDPIQRLDQVWGKLDSIAQEGRSGLSVQHHEAPDRSTPRGGTTSDVDSNVVVGREDDLNKVVDLLLSDYFFPGQMRCGFLAIVGSGGIGKTTLAQLVYNDTRIQDAFPIRGWISAYGNDPDQVAEKCKEQHNRSLGLKTLLIIDDVWNNIDLSYVSATETAIVITTRSQSIARYVGKESQYNKYQRLYDNSIYELKGLSEQSSWQLFEMIAFGKFRDQIHPSEYAQMAKKIANICCGLPAAMKMAGNLLYGQDLSKWTWFVELEPAKAWQYAEVMSILRLRYDYLDLPLKCCFSYCALFPQDFVINKRMLISLWMAQGYIEPSMFEGEELQSIADVGDYYFCALLQNGYFEVVERGEYGGVISCKINNWMHNVAQYIAREEVYFTKPGDNQLGVGIYHVFHTGEHSEETFPNEATIRSYHWNGFSPISMDTIVQQWPSLRVLGLHNSDIKSLPDSIGKLCLLRYLNLSHNKNLKELPSSIVNLHNLQTLDLRFCSLLKELPQELHKLSELICLDVFGCEGLAYMPPGLDRLTRLEMLSNFVVGESKSSEKQSRGQLKDLVKLTKLKGRLCINIPSTHANVKRMVYRSDNVWAMEGLDELWVRFPGSHPADDSDARVRNYHEDSLERLQPPTWIRELMIWGYQGDILPWGSRYEEMYFELSILIRFELRSSQNLQQLLLLCRFGNLKSLKLYGLMNLVFLQNIDCDKLERLNYGFFFSLEEFQIVNAPKLRGIINDLSFPPQAFESLVKLEIRSCQKLQQLPNLSELSHLVSVKLCGLSNLDYLEKRDSSSGTTSGVSASVSPEEQLSFFPCLESLEITNAAKLRGLWLRVGQSGLVDDTIIGKGTPPTSCFPRLKSLKLVNLPELRGFFFALNGDSYEQLDHLYVPQFGCLKELEVSCCPLLMSLPMMPSLDSLSAGHVLKELLNRLLGAQGSLSSSTKTPRTIHKLSNVNIVSVNDLECLSITTVDVESITIRQCQHLSKLTLRCPASVKKLSIHECGELKHVSPPLQQLTSLEELNIEGCQKLDWEINYAEDEANHIGSSAAWQGLCNLRSLTLTNISNFQSVSRGIGCLPILELLRLSWLWDLRALPESFNSLANLRQLTVSYCPNLIVFPESLCRLSTLKMLVLEHCCRLRIPKDLSAKSSQLEIRITPNL